MNWNILPAIICSLFLFSGLGRANENSKDKNVTSKTLKVEIAIFAGGCFWCLQPAFDELMEGKGVLLTTVGFTGGKIPHPSYESVATGQTQHVESIEIHYDPTKVSYETLLDIYYRNIDPTDGGGQFSDRGPHYRPVIFYLNEAQEKAARNSKQKLQDSKKFTKNIAVEITAATPFYPAEEKHQKYYDKNKLRYQTYSRLSGRKSFIEKNWK
ncbi:MAG: peptide-methionine (S)-S-oxide reductase MsrA [Bdellovibrionales bacterium]|nr:peptide-methionine (S)-S-oxide reductase MsrA [Bdellovibrionales bacterium]